MASGSTNQLDRAQLARTRDEQKEKEKLRTSPPFVQFVSCLVATVLGRCAPPSAQNPKPRLSGRRAHAATRAPSNGQFISQPPPTSVRNFFFLLFFSVLPPTPFLLKKMYYDDYLRIWSLFPLKEKDF